MSPSRNSMCLRVCWTVSVCHTRYLKGSSGILLFWRAPGIQRSERLGRREGLFLQCLSARKKLVRWVTCAKEDSKDKIERPTPNGLILGKEQRLGILHEIPIHFCKSQHANQPTILLLIEYCNNNGGKDWQKPPVDPQGQGRCEVSSA